MSSHCAHENELDFPQIHKIKNNTDFKIHSAIFTAVDINFVLINHCSRFVVSSLLLCIKCFIDAPVFGRRCVRACHNSKCMKSCDNALVVAAMLACEAEPETNRHK